MTLLLTLLPPYAMTDLARLYLFFAACMFLAAYNLRDERSLRHFAACLWIGLIWPVVIVVPVFEKLLK